MKTASIIIGAIILIFGVGYLVTNEPDRSVAVIQESSTDNISDTETITTQEATSTDETGVADTATSEAVSTADAVAGVYTTYDADAIAKSDAEHILLFFHATWCPSCKALDADIVANANDIPPGVEIYRADFDTATDLRRQYGVTLQHSVIEINASGEALSGISHGLRLKDVLTTI